MTKILLFANIGTFGGTKTHLKNLLNYYTNKKTDIWIASDTYENVLKVLDQLKLKKIKVIRIPKKPKILVFFFNYLIPINILFDLIIVKLLIIKIKPNFFIVTPASLTWYISSSIIDLRKIFIIHSYPEKKISSIFKFLLKINKQKTKIITVSKESKNKIVRNWGVNSDYVYNPPEKYVLKKLKKTIILTSGHLEWYKDPMSWLEVVKKISLVKPDIKYKFIWIGSGSLKDKVKNLIKNHKLQKYCEIIDPKKDLSSLISKTYIYFQPSIIESQGIVVTSVQYNKIPVVSTTAGGLSEMVINNKTGLTVNPKDTTAMAESIIKMINNPKKVIKMGLEGKKHIEKIASEQNWKNRMDSFHKSMDLEI
ncbi:MAG: glycosyltransferase [Candidatus Pacebacteria bacterium]|jgi:glycosyltransferase involved in cell wall biosynthesis|nr:glycosyltransferase [Candidatus Paceibacterota bacterium]MBT6756062.1 glycosyltransferase [Candidatus Paceibacterota bacterium]